MSVCPLATWSLFHSHTPISLQQPAKHVNTILLTYYIHLNMIPLHLKSSIFSKIPIWYMFGFVFVYKTTPYFSDDVQKTSHILFR